MCGSCGQVHYSNPRMVVGSIPEQDGRVLLCRRAIEPRRGCWTLPAGYLESGEAVEQAVERETREETGARIELGGPFSLISVPRVNQVNLYYRATLVELSSPPGPETLEVRLFPAAEMPWDALAFGTVKLTLQRWIARRERDAGRLYVDILNLDPELPPLAPRSLA